MSHILSPIVSPRSEADTLLAIVIGLILASGLLALALGGATGQPINGSNQTNATTTPAASTSVGGSGANQTPTAPQSSPANTTTTPGAGSGAAGGGSGGSGGGIGGVLPDGPIQQLRQALSDIVQDVIKGAVDTIDQVKNAAIRGITITPSANDPGNFYQNPTNLAYPQILQLWEELGQSLAILSWLGSAGFLLLFGRAGYNLVGWAIEKRLWFGLILTAALVTDMGWVVANAIPDIVDVFVQALLFDFTEQSVSSLGLSALIVVVALLGLYFEVFLLIGLAVLAALRIEVIMFMTPLIPALFVLGWGCPSKIARALSQTGILLWVVLLVSGVPSALFISGAMVISQGGMLDTFGLGAAAALVFQLGGFLAALVSPIVILKTMLPLLGLFGPTGVSETSEKVSEKQQQYRRKIRNDRERAGSAKQAAGDAKSGFTNGQPRDDSGQFREQTRAYRATNTARKASASAKKRASRMRERARRD